jgi:hypothetical protein
VAAPSARSSSGRMKWMLIVLPSGADAIFNARKVSLALGEMSSVSQASYMTLHGLSVVVASAALASSVICSRFS